MAHRLFLFISILSGARASWTILPNTRCHNDISQVRNITTIDACEAASGGSLFSWCPPSGADGCSASVPGPQPGTCWGYALSSLSSCEPGTGWTSGWQPATPPAPPPADWAAAVARGDMAYSTLSPEAVGVGFFPVVANGFVGIEVGPFTQVFENTWPWRDAGSAKLAGVYSGQNFRDPSHRAQIPKTSDVTLLPEAGATYTAVGAAIDFARGVYYNRTRIAGAPRCDDTIIEQRQYAHRALRELLVFELTAFSASGAPGWAGCSLPVRWVLTPEGLNDTALTVQPPGSSGSPTVWVGSTTIPEEPGLPLRSLAVAFDSWVGAGPTELNFTAAEPTLSVFAVLRSDLDVGAGATPATVAAAAAATWAEYAAQGSAALLASHEASWSELWTAGVELQGNATFACTVNASLYDIVSSLREDWNWSTSPGGLATGAYSGHTFWDMETWMFPVLTALFPSLARVTAAYRFDRLGAYEANAAASGYDGAMISWESAFTGFWASPWRAADLYEYHIDADVPLAHRRFFYATGDTDFLAESWPLLNATCRFWACRFTRTDSSGPPPPGFALNCSAKNGAGNWTLHNVIPPDESSGITSDSVYTNAAGAQTLAWCIEAAGVLGYADLPQLWATIASSPYLPISDTLYAGGPVHVQDKTYYAPGKQINQADVALLQYPLGLDFGAAQNQRDLDFYAEKTNFAGMFTGDTSYSASYLALGDRALADSQLSLAFAHIHPAFNVFTETAWAGGGHSQHFITGSGGYLQAFVFGYPGMRIARRGVFTFTSQQPVLPPLGVTAVKVRGLHLLGVAVDVTYDATNFCAELQDGPQPATPLELRAAGASHLVSTINTCVSVAAGGIELAGVGYA